MLRPSSYRAAARKLRHLADQIERRADAQSPRERTYLTRAINGAAQHARSLSDRHRRSS